MSGDKRSVSTDALETLGSVIDEHAGRDAIHVAVEPVMADEVLRPGQDVSVSEGVAFAHETVVCKFVGIVDPFLKSPVKPGEYFWLLVYPRTITSLRHVWSHPAFEDKEPCVAPVADKSASETWLRDFCENKIEAEYEAVVKQLVDSDGSDTCFYGTDTNGELTDLFWFHMEVVTGHKFAYKNDWFSCSC